MNDICFYITRSIRSEIHMLIYIDCIESINKSYPGAPIVVIRDNESFDFNKYDIVEKDKDNIFFIDSEYKGVAETLRFYYYWKVCNDREKYKHIPATKYAICMHDSMFLQTQIKLNLVDKYGYQDFFTAKKGWNIPKDELAVIELIQKNKEILYKTYYNDDKWNTNFGVCSVVTYDFINKVNEKFNLFNDIFLKSIKEYKQRVALERIWGLMFACVNFNPTTVWGDINVYHGWMVQRFKLNKDFYYEFYMKNKDYYNNFPIIKCWCGR